MQPTSFARSWCRTGTALFAALLTVLPAVAADAQETAPPAATPLHLNVVVTPDGHEPVANLPQSAFTVLDNGQPQTITSFRPVSGRAAATEVMIVIDAVNVRYTQLAYERQELQKFLKSNDGRLAAPTKLVVLTDTTLEATPPTTDGNALSDVLAQKTIALRELRRSAGFYGAQERLDISLRAMHQALAQLTTVPGHKVVLWISPGWPLLSGPGIQLTAKESQGIFHDVVNFAAEIRRADVTIYSIDPLGAVENVERTFYYRQFVKGLRKPSQADLGDLGLQVLAVQSGGLALNSSNDIAGLLTKALRDTTAEYQLTLAPSAVAPDGKYGYHELDIRVSGAGGHARALQGYYSQP